MKYLENSLAGWYGIDLMYILAYMVEIMVTMAWHGNKSLHYHWWFVLRIHQWVFLLIGLSYLADQYLINSQGAYQCWVSMTTPIASCLGYDQFQGIWLVWSKVRPWCSLPTINQLRRKLKQSLKRIEYDTFNLNTFTGILHPIQHNFWSTVPPGSNISCHLIICCSCQAKVQDLWKEKVNKSANWTTMIIITLNSQSSFTAILLGFKSCNAIKSKIGRILW